MLLAALAGTALALGACATHPDGDKAAASEPLLPTEQFKLEASASPDEIRLDPHPTGLSPAQIGALTALADRWQEAGGGELTIQVPQGTPAADRAAGEARLVLLNAGAPSQLVRQASYQPAAGQPAALIVGFAAHQPVIPRCGESWDNVTATGQNKPMQNFGCAVTADMAAQIANPGDIAGPRASDPPDAGRQTTVIETYRTGKLTGGANDNRSSGAISAGAGGGGSSGSSGGGGGG
jgi:pilus assembly protein CpaD